MTALSVAIGQALPLASPLGAGVGGASFDPVALFAANNAPFYDVSDLTSLYQDAAKSVPATTVGDRVRVISDLSTPGLDLVAPSDTARGTLRQDPRGNYYVEFLANQCAFSSASYTITVPCWLIAGFSYVGFNSAVCVFGAGKATNSANRIVPSGSSRVEIGIIDPVEGDDKASTALASFPENLPGVADGITSNLNQAVGVNGGLLWDNARGITGAFTVSGLRLCVNTGTAGNSASTATQTNFYGGGIIGINPTSEQRELLTSYFKAKMSIDALESQDYDIFAIAGQSNGTGQGDFATSTPCPWGDGVEYQDGFIKPLTDPTRHYATNVAGNVSGTGSAWPAFAAKYFELTGRRACIVGGCASGVGLTTSGGWNPSAVWRTALAAKTAAAKAFIESKGGTATVRGVIWLGGETDGVSAVSEATFEAGLSTLLSNLRTAFGDSSLPIFMMSVDQTTDAGQDAAFAAIRQAIVDAAAAVDGLELAMPYQSFEVNGQLEDTIHWNQTALNSAGEIVATNIAAILFP